MMSKYSEEVRDAYDGIQEAGAEATITRTSGSGGPVGGDTTTIEAGTFVVETQFSAQEIDGTSILATDVKLIVPAYNLALEPEAGDKVSYAGQTLTIINPMRVAPDGEAILYELQARR